MPAALGLLVSMALTLLTWLGTFDPVEYKILNVKFQLRPKIKINPDIISIDIDDGALDVTGRWPWPWNIHGDIVNFLTNYGVQGIVFTGIDFSQDSNNDIDRGAVEGVKNRIRSAYEKKDINSAMPDYESYLLDSIKKNGNAYIDIHFNIPEFDEKHGFVSSLKNKARATEVEKKRLELLSQKIGIKGNQGNFPLATGILTPKEIIMKSMEGGGFNQILISNDGVVRKYPLLAYYPYMLYESLPLNLARKLLNMKDVNTENSNYIELKGEQSSIKIPVDKEGRMNINWAGGNKDSFMRLPFKVVSFFAAFHNAKKELMKFTFIDDEAVQKLETELAEIPYLTKDEVDNIIGRVFTAFLIEQNIVDNSMSITGAIKAMGGDPDDDLWLSIAKQIKFNNHIVKKHEEHKVLPSFDDVITELSFTDSDVESMSLAESYNIMVYHIGRNDVFSVRPLYFHIPVNDINGKHTVISPVFFRDKIVFYGLTATALAAMNPTPFMWRHPMLDLMPNVLNTIMTGRFLTDCPLWLKYSLNFILVIVVLTVVMFFSPLRSGPIALAVTAGCAAVDWYLFTMKGLLLPIFQTTVAIVLTFLSGVLYRYIRERMERQKIRKMFSTMVSPEVLKLIEKNPEKFNLGGEKKHATMFSSDVSGFTTISEGVTSRELADILNIYLTPMSNIIMSYNGYVDKYEGDAIKADFGIPLTDEDHAWKCCYSALYSQEELKVIQRMIAIKYGVKITARMGINSGDISAGNMGSYNHMQYTAMGDAVTVAEELEPANKIFDTWIMMSQSTFELVKEYVEARYLGVLERGHGGAPVGIYEVAGWKRERFLEYWKSKPIPELIFNSLSKMRPEKVIGYHDYFSKKELPDSEFLTDVKTLFSELTTDAVEYMKLGDILNMAEIERDIRNLLLKIKQYDEHGGAASVQTETSTTAAWKEKISEMRKNVMIAAPYLKKLKDRGERTLSDSLYSTVDILEKKLQSVEKRILFAEAGDHIATELSNHLKELLTKPSGNTETGAITLEMKTKERRINERLKQFTLKLKKHPENFHQLMSNLCTVDERKKELLQLFTAAQQHYYNRNWHEAAKNFNLCLSIDPQDGPSVKYLNTIKQLLISPPDSTWQGLWQEG